jgi:hypothetical protein
MGRAGNTWTDEGVVGAELGHAANGGAAGGRHVAVLWQHHCRVGIVEHHAVVRVDDLRVGVANTEYIRSPRGRGRIGAAVVGAGAARLADEVRRKGLGANGRRDLGVGFAIRADDDRRRGIEVAGLADLVSGDDIGDVVAGLGVSRMPFCPARRRRILGTSGAD